ncbi:single-stranded DNA-binding protein [Prosthecochloris sp. HL-130-GSB]|jgi:single-strand DNA-binding protein|uniref:Single-stranded DNA-binding protein n=1 Tax=Prosthecochloris aestuarii TaxID=1102 RepID=A0A831SS61_PROAE|nr:single-stranded DNA-binding protein [Prosthecochloris sp. HL-130-GSB]ARM31540.1 single-stranded DNA-binding protein [Prosthecochloris sp. HL-130-GSB]MBO8093545.1 single-stranded DNA-binding protein [Prosthecochloris sp.]HED30754.1 single-stranded DNA-binding protein [Prosthecochloris aestuarii]
MARGLNKVMLIGHLGTDPELRVIASGQSVANFTVATNESFKDSSGNLQERTEWHRIVVWGRLAEICQQYLKKGRQVYIEGKLQTRSWDDQKTGEKRYATEIVCTDMQMLGSPREQSGGYNPGGGNSGYQNSDHNQGGGTQGGGFQNSRDSGYQGTSPIGPADQEKDDLPF